MDCKVLAKITEKEIVKLAAEGLSFALAAVQEITEDITLENTHDREVIEAVNNARIAVDYAFVHGRSYIDKVYSLAELICKTESDAIEAVKDGNAEDFKDYLEVVLSKSSACQRDIIDLLEFISKKEKDFQEDKMKIEISKKQADAKVMHAELAAQFGQVLKISGTIFSYAGGIALSLSVAAVPLVGGIVATAVPAMVTGGLASVVIGILIKWKSSGVKIENEKLVALCIKALQAINYLQECLVKVNEDLSKVNAGLKTGVDNVLEDLLKTEQLEKIHRKSRFAQTSLEGSIKLAVKGATNLKEYCQPLRDAKSLKDFMDQATEKKHMAVKAQS